MNMKQKRTPLKVEFKQFQRLPDWPLIVQLTGTDRSFEERKVSKAAMASLLAEQNRFGIRSLAE